MCSLVEMRLQFQKLPFSIHESANSGVIEEARRFVFSKASQFLLAFENFCQRCLLVATVGTMTFRESSWV